MWQIMHRKQLQYPYECMTKFKSVFYTAVIRQIYIYILKLYTDYMRRSRENAVIHCAKFVTSRTGHDNILKWREYDIVAINEWKKKCVVLQRTWVSKRTVQIRLSAAFIPCLHAIWRYIVLIFGYPCGLIRTLRLNKKSTNHHLTSLSSSIFMLVHTGNCFLIWASLSHF